MQPTTTVRKALLPAPRAWAAIGLVLLAGGASSSSADLAELVAPGTSAKKVAGGFQFVEGPAWSPKGFLLFSDIPASRIVRLLDGGATEDFLAPSGNANGLAFDAAGRVYACQGGARRVVRIEPGADKTITPLADSFDGKKLNSPNDLALDAHGGVYFTDPRYGSGSESDGQPVQGVYYVDAAGKVSRVIDDLQRPNGILVSPTGRHLYVANPDRRELWRYDVAGPGRLAGKKLVFTGEAELDGGGPDGMAHDARGNVYATYKGIVVLDPEGSLIGRLEVPEHPSNCIFGGKDLTTLYVTARTSLYAIETRVAGAPLPTAPEAGAAARPAATPESKAAAPTREVKTGDLLLAVPAAWKDVGGDGRMRAGQFELPAGEGDKEPGELIVYYFGPGGAGGVAANLERWIGQFDATGRKVKLTEGKSARGRYTLADGAGTFKKPVGPPVSQETRTLSGARMLAAIIETDKGPYFLKLTGLEKTVNEAAAAFRASFGASAKDESEYRLPR